MGKVIVFTTNSGDRYDGRARIMWPNWQERAAGESEAGFLGRCIATLPPDATCSIIDAASIPDDARDPVYRNARTFDHTTKEWGIDMAKARDTHREVIREARKPMLEAEDIELTAAIATGDTVAARAAEAERQRLRDAPQDPTIESAQTIDQLKKVNPLERKKP